jgi:hypothetical protein
VDTNGQPRPKAMFLRNANNTILGMNTHFHNITQIACLVVAMMMDSSSVHPAQAAASTNNVPLSSECVVGHTATALRDGSILVAGGQDPSGITDRAAVYDPTTGHWTTAGRIATARFGHTATLLSNGKVLIAGGYGLTNGNGTLSSAEVYDPSTRLWADAGNMTMARIAHTATWLQNGEVLVTGGEGGGEGYRDIKAHSTAQLYNPLTGNWRRTGFMAVGRYGHTATLLPNGKVLVAGGCLGGSNCTSAAELYDPLSGLWAKTGSMNHPREGHTAGLLLNGKVLAVGGFDPSHGDLFSAELYDPVAGIWTETAAMSNARVNHTMTLLPNGKVLVAGGFNPTTLFLASAELYDPISRMWMTAGALNHARGLHKASLLTNGQVMVIGGATGATNFVCESEMYDADAKVWTRH